jgi:uncharacterized protein YajQ (UPF0234 family)
VKYPVSSEVKMADSSMDIVSKVDRQEADNALGQAAKELATRFDFKGTETSIEWKGELGVEISSSTEDRAKAALEVFREKLIKRGVSLKSFTAGDPRLSGKDYKINGEFKGEELRVTGKSRDDLQAVQQLLSESDLDFAVQYTNYR